MGGALMERAFSLKSGETVRFRTPEPTDAAACLAFLAQVSGETEFLLMTPDIVSKMTLESEETFLTARRDDPRNLMLLGYIGDELCCICDIRAGVRPRFRHNAELAISIKQAHWNKGLGTAAFSAMIDWARAQGDIRMLRLSVFRENVRGLALYQKMGFAVCGCNCGFARIGERYVDELIMERAL